jgi:hypothetical protein
MVGMKIQLSHFYSPKPFVILVRANALMETTPPEIKIQASYSQFSDQNRAYSTHIPHHQLIPHVCSPSRLFPITIHYYYYLLPSGYLA